MATPVYKLYFFKAAGKALDLSPAERLELFQMTDEPARRLGVRHLLSAEMTWSSEQYDIFGVEQFPSQQAVVEYSRALREAGWYDYIQAESYLGIPMDSTANEIRPPEPPPAGEPAVYRVYLARLTRCGLDLAPEALNELSGRAAEESRKNGGQLVLSAYMRWNNEEWEYFGVERYPNLEAVVRFSQYLTVTNWYKYWYARSHLGVAVGGSLSGLE